MDDLQGTLDTLDAILETLTTEERTELECLAKLGRATDQATGARRTGEQRTPD